MRRTITILSILTLSAMGCSTINRTADTTDPQSVQTTERVATAGELPSGSTLRVELDETLGEQSQVGDEFSATVAHNVEGPGGSIVVPSGAKVYGEVTGVDRSERMGDPAAIRLHFTSLAFNGDTYPLDAEVIATELTEERSKGDIARDVGIGAAAGAILGAVIGGDAKGALIGGALGAGAGTAIALGTGDVDPELKAGTDIVLRTEDDVAVATR